MAVGTQEGDDEDDCRNDEQSGDLAAEHGYRVQAAGRGVKITGLCKLTRLRCAAQRRW